MAREWNADNPKADLMAQKRALLVGAALRAFLENGYAASSVNRIAQDAGVSIKTLYRHFESKDDLFTAVMVAACEREEGEMPEWFSEPPERALPLAGADYLRHVLSEQQMALYRVVVRDALRFPELGHRYHAEVVSRRDDTFAAYLDRWLPSLECEVTDKKAAAAAFSGLLKARLFDEVAYGVRTPAEKDIAVHAKRASTLMLLLLKSGQL